MEALEAALGPILSCIKTAKSIILSYAAKSPFLALAVVITISTLALPLITMAVLMPVVILFRFGEYLGTKGILSIIYTACFQITFLIALLLVLLIITFALGAIGNILHCKLFKNVNKETTCNLDYMYQNNVFTEKN